MEQSPKDPSSHINIVHMPGIRRAGGIDSMLAPRDPGSKFAARLEAITEGWPTDRHVTAERVRQIPIVGNYIADLLHTRMLRVVSQRRSESQQTRIY